MVRSKVRTITGRYGLSGQLLDQVGSGRLLTGVGGGRMVTEVRKRALGVRSMIPVKGLGLMGEITDNPNVTNISIEGFPAARDEGRAVSAYSDVAVYVE